MQVIDDNRQSDISPPSVVALPHGRVPPHNLDAERSLLGGILLDAQAFDQVKNLVSAADFYRDAHRKVFEAMAALDEDDVAIDRVSLKARLVELGTLDGAGGEDFVDLLDKFPPVAGNLLYYGKIVRDKAVARRIIEAATHTVQALYEQGGEFKGVAGDAYDRMMGAIEQVKVAPPNRFTAAYTRLTVEQLSVDPPPPSFILKPYIPAERVSVLSAAGGSGKTTLTALLAASRAMGRRMLEGLYPREGETAILTTEDRLEDYQAKFAALREHLGPEYDRAAVSERVHLFDMSGLPVRLVLAERGEQFRPSPEVDELAEALKLRAPKVDHIIIETISRVTGGVETNPSLSMLIAAGERLCLLTKAAVTFVGHVGQNAGAAGRADQYANRGGTALVDNARSAMVLAALTDKNVEAFAPGLEISDEDLQHTLVLTAPKVNRAAPTAPRLLRRLSTRFGPVLVDAKYSAIPGASTTPSASRGKRGRPAERTYDQLLAAITDVVAKKGPVSGNAVFHTVGGKKTLFTGAIQDMLREGRIGRDAESRLVVPKSVPKSVPNQMQLGTDGPKPLVPNSSVSPFRGETRGDELGTGQRSANKEPGNKEPPEGEVF